MWFGDMGWGGMIFGGIFMVICMVIFWGGLIALVLWVGRKLGRLYGPAPSAPKHDPLEIAKERYAKGELSREEFKQIKEDLS